LLFLLLCCHYFMFLFFKNFFFNSPSLLNTFWLYNSFLCSSRHNMLCDISSFFFNFLSLLIVFSSCRIFFKHLFSISFKLFDSFFINDFISCKIFLKQSLPFNFSFNKFMNYSHKFLCKRVFIVSSACSL